MHAGNEAEIGPNAITRVIEALRPEEAEAVFVHAGLEDRLRHPPERMVPDREVARLHEALHAVLGTARALEVGADAGRRTGAYLLARRIPAPARTVLPFLPARLALKILLRAIERHAWTFAGAGSFAWREEDGAFVLEIAGGPVARRVRAPRPACSYYAETFETIFRAVVAPGARVTETACEARGAPCCRFTVDAGRKRPRPAEAVSSASP